MTAIDYALDVLAPFALIMLAVGVLLGWAIGLGGAA